MRSHRVWMGWFLCLAVVGCSQDSKKAGEDEHAITGKVYLDDKIINYGDVAFYKAEDERPLKSPIYPDGAYNIRNPPKGEYRIVIITGTAPVPAAGGTSKSPPPSFKTITIPDKYTEFKTTDLRYVVKEGRHTFDIKLQSGK